MSKVDSIKRSFPRLYKPDSNTFIKALLEIIGEEDDKIVQQIQNAKDQLFVKTAVGSFLNTLGSNVGVKRPLSAFGSFVDDDFFRNLIPLLSYAPKQIKDTMQDILFVFFGNDPDVFIEEVNPNEIVIQVPAILVIVRDQLEGATHFHTTTGDIVKIDNTLKQITVNFALERNEIENFNSLHNFTTSTGVSNLRKGLPRDIETTSIESIAFDKTGFTESFASIIKTFSYSQNISENEFITTWCYIDDLTNVSGVRVTLHTGGDSSEYDISDTELREGWNILNIELASPNMVNGSGADLTDINQMEFEVLFDGTGFTLADIRFDSLIGTPPQSTFILDQFVGKTLSQHTNTAVITGSSAGQTGVVLQFGGGEDLSVFDIDNTFHILNEQFTGDFVFYPQGPGFTISKNNAILNQSISNGDPGGIVSFVDSTDIPDAPGYLVFNYGKENEETLVPYLERNSSNSLIIDPAYNFLLDHNVGEFVQLVTDSAFEPADDGHDMAIYNVGTEEPVEAAKTLLDLVKASGVVIRFLIKVE